MFCPKCGTAQDDNSNFCDSCGHSMKALGTQTVDPVMTPRKDSTLEQRMDYQSNMLHSKEDVNPDHETQNNTSRSAGDIVLGIGACIVGGMLALQVITMIVNIPQSGGAGGIAMILV